MKIKKTTIFVIFFFFLALLLRVLVFPYLTHWSDMHFWEKWGQQIASSGPAGFYEKTASDYLPFYPLVLGLVKKLYEFLRLGFPVEYAYKFPAVIFDLATGVVLWLFLRKKRFLE